jgi:cell division inhibitor SepF
MGTLQKLKAYFGMVPAEDFAEFDTADGYDDRGYGRDYGHRPGYLSDDEYEPYPARRARALLGGQRYDDTAHDGSDQDYQPPASRNRSRPVWATDTPPAPVHGALAVETRREPVSRLRTEPRPEPAAPSSYPLGRIVTLHPTSYNEARGIGEAYREGTPVIMNLTEMDDADAKRLVDFAAGLAFALRGSIDKVTNKVFLISPPNVDPSAEDKRRIAEGGLLTRG